MRSSAETVGSEYQLGKMLSPALHRPDHGFARQRSVIAQQDSCWQKAAESGCRVAMTNLASGEVSNRGILFGYLVPKPEPSPKRWQCLCLMRSDVPVDVNDQPTSRGLMSGLCLQAQVLQAGLTALGLDFPPKLLPSISWNSVERTAGGCRARDTKPPAKSWDRFLP